MLSDKSNKLKQAKKLLSAKERKKQGLALVEGTNLLEVAHQRDLLQSVLVAEASYLQAEAFYKTLLTAGIVVDFISEKAVGELAGTVTSPGVFGIIDITPFYALNLSSWLDSLEIQNKGYLIYLDQISDPGNAGTIIRLADAFKAAGIILSASSVDLFNAKLLRSTAGSVFNLPIFQIADSEELLVNLARVGWNILSTELTATLNLQQITPVLQQKHVWIFGNEAKGVSEQVSSLATHKVKIEMSNQVQSLNVATAAAICTYNSALVQDNC